MENIIVPQQLVGSQMDISSETICLTLTEATVLYEVAKERLFKVNNWDKVCGTEATCFQLTDSDGQPAEELVEGCLIRIDIPGPGTSIGDGYDWVMVEKIVEQSGEGNQKFAAFTVRPCANPANPAEGTAHFFSNCATSTFMVTTYGTSVKAEIHGRNEVANGENESIFDGLRNTMVGWSAKIGLSFPQWKLLVEGICKKQS